MSPRTLRPVPYRLGLEVEAFSKAPFLKLGKHTWGEREDFVETEGYTFWFKFKNLGTVPFPSGKAWMRVEWTFVRQAVRWEVIIPHLEPGHEGYAKFDTGLEEHESEALSSGFGLFFCGRIDPSNTRLTSLDGRTVYEIGYGQHATSVRSIKVTTWNSIYAMYSMYISAAALIFLVFEKFSEFPLWLFRFWRHFFRRCFFPF